MGPRELAPRAPSGRSGENVNRLGAGDTVPRPLGLPGGGLGRESGPEQEARGGSPPPVPRKGKGGGGGQPAARSCHTGHLQPAHRDVRQLPTLGPPATLYSLKCSDAD